MKFPEDDDSSGDNDDYDHDAENEEGWTDQSNPPEDDDSYDNGYDDDGFQATWAPSEGRESAMVVVDTIHGVGLENPSEAQNSGTIFVLFIFWRRGNAESGWRTAES